MSAREVRVVLGGAPVVDGISCAANAGELLGIIGPNGAGKTTLLRALAGLRVPTSGDVHLRGMPLRSSRPAQRARAIAYLPQSGAYGHSFTALEAVLMGRYPHLGRFQLEGRRDREIALSAMGRTHTREFANRKLSEISGGERQRVLIARTLAQSPAVLLLDEPTASLDLKHQLSTMAMLRGEVTNGLAAVVAMHDLSLAGRFCDRLLLMNTGRVVAEGLPLEVLSAANIRDVFGVDASVSVDPLTGRPRIALLGPASDGSGDVTSRNLRVHLVCGAGSGRFLMQTLAGAGHTVSLGVLGAGDADREAADQLGLEYVGGAPFSPIGAESHERHIDLVRRADCVVLCDMPVGAYNLPNLEAALAARRILLVAERPFSQRDYTGGEAGRIYERLQGAGVELLESQVPAAIARDAAPAGAT